MRSSPARSWFSSKCRCALHCVSVDNGRLPPALAPPLLLPLAAFLPGAPCLPVVVVVELSRLWLLLIVLVGLVGDVAVGLVVRTNVAAPASLKYPGRVSTHRQQQVTCQCACACGTAVSGV